MSSKADSNNVEYRKLIKTTKQNVVLNSSVKIKKNDFSFFNVGYLIVAIATSDCAYQLGLVSNDPPDNSATAATGQCHDIPDELASVQIPQLDGAVIGGCHHKVLVKVNAGDRTFMLGVSWKKYKATINISCSSSKIFISKQKKLGTTKNIKFTAAKSFQASSCPNIPHSDSGICIARNKNVIALVHPAN